MKTKLVIPAALWVLAAVAGAMTTAPPSAFAQPKAVTVKINGTVGEAPDEGRPRATWHLRVNREDVKLYVTKLEILAGATTDAEIIRQLRVNRAAILTEGEADAMKKLGASPPGTAVTIQGTMRWTSTPPVLLVSSVGGG